MIPFANPVQEMASMIGDNGGRKKTRRGRRRGKGEGPQHHLTKAHHALKAGDHAAVKRHAFDLIKSLPASEREDLIEELAPTKSEPAKAAAKPSLSGSAKLAMMLKGRGNNSPR